MTNFLLYKGDSEAIFVYIQQLTPEQKKRFTQQFKPGKGKKKPLFYQLYEGLQRLETYDDAEARKLIASKDYIKVLRALTEKLIYIQLLHEKEEQPRIAIIRAAMGLGAIHIVRKAMVKEVLDAMAKGDLTQLLIAWKFLNHLRRTFGVDLRPDLPANCPSELETIHCLQLTAQAGQLLDDLEVGFQWQYPKRLELVGSTLPLTQSIAVTQSVLSQVYVYPTYRVMTRVNLLAGQLNEAIQYQLRVLRILPHLPQLDMAAILHEYHLMAHLWASAKKFEEARNLIQDIQSVKTQHPMEENLRLRFEVKCLVGIGIRSWDLGLAHEAYAKLEQQLGLFYDLEKGMLDYQIALIHFVHGQFEDASRQLRDLINLPKAINDEVRIWAELLLAAAYISRQEPSLACDVLDDCKKMIALSNSSLANLIHQFLNAIHPWGSRQKSPDQVEAIRRSFLTMMKAGIDVECLWYFDALQWFEAKNRGLSPKALQDLGEPGWAWNGLADELDLAASYRDIVYPLPER